MRSIAPDVEPFLDMTAKEFMVAVKPVEVKTGRDLMYEYCTGYYPNFAFPDRRNVEKILQHVDAPTTFKLGTPIYTEDEKLIVRSTRFYSSLPKKSAPPSSNSKTMYYDRRNKGYSSLNEKEAPVPALTDLLIWGGDDLLAVLTERGHGKTYYMDEEKRAKLLASSWLMDSPITTIELVLVIAHLWGSYEDLPFTIREWTVALSSQNIRAIAGMKMGKQSTFTTDVQKDRAVRYVHERFLSAKYPEDERLLWLILVMYPIMSNAENANTSESLVYLKSLSRKYTATEVAPFVLDGFAPKQIGYAMDHGIDLSLMDSLFAG